ncbi:MAG: GIY-YIG nuclease family protein [Fulvivirga sp.]|nr:GIY-YIG nuclease family protein [Fulvivirga sp.]
MNYYVYILYSQSLNSFYRGQTADVDRRLREHNNKKEMSTKHGAPWMLLWVAEKQSRSEAIKLEAKLKNLSKNRLMKFMLKYQEQCSSPDALLFIKQWSGC